MTGVYPATRFAYLYLMLLSLFKCIAAVRVVIDSPVYKLCKEQTRKRGGEEGRKALASTAQGRNAYSSLYLASMQLLWDKAEAREARLAKEEIKRPVEDEEGLGYVLAETLKRLKLARCHLTSRRAAACSAA